MCNACGFFCCAYDGFSGCGCDHCPNPACWPDDPDEYDDDDNDFYCEEIDPPLKVVNVGDELHDVLREALDAAGKR